MKPNWQLLPKALGQGIREAREEAGMTKKDFAFAACISDRHVRRLENGEQGCSVTMLWQVAHALQTDAAKLIDLAIARVKGGFVR